MKTRLVPSIEALEARIAPATIVVRSLADTVGNPAASFTLRDAIAAANADLDTDVIVFDPSLFASGPQTITLSQLAGFGDYDITNSLVIRGPGADKLTINASKASRHFDINDGGSRLLSVSISGMTLVDGSATGADGAGVTTDGTDGGAIRSTESLSLSGMLIQGNTAGGNGAGVCVDTAGTFSMTKSQVLGNVATNPGVVNRGGGIFVVAQAGITVSDTIVANNEADAAGGMLLNAGSASARAVNIVLDRVTVSSNIASLGGGGGAILDNDAMTGIARIFVRNSVFVGNTSADAGGALELNDGTVSISDTLFSGNRAVPGGGAIVDRASEVLSITRGTFVGNSTTGADSDGGAICAINDGRLVIANSLFAGNRATDQGGAIILDNASLDATFSNTVFTSNSSGGAGGAVSVRSDARLVVNDGSFTANNAGTDGGGIFAITGDGVTVNRTLFTANRSLADGGAICAGPATAVTVNSARFLQNSSAARGGALAVEGSGALVVKSSVLTSNIAASLGGAIFRTSTGALSIESSLLQQNVGGSGGAVASDGSGDVSVRSSRILGNIATAGSGGGLNLSLSAGTIDIRATTIAHNVANIDGGGLVIASAGTKSVLSSVITGNIAAGGEGGGVITSTAGSPLVLTGTRIVSNIAAVQGGGLRNDTGGAGAITGGVITGNTAPVDPNASL